MRHTWLGVDVIFPILTLLAAALIASDTGGSGAYLGPRTPAGNPPTNEFDQRAAQLLAKGNFEARRWLNATNETHAVWKWNKAAALDAVNDLYRAGATGISVANPSKLDRGGEMASHFVVALPTDPRSRQKLFSWIARWEKDAQVDQTDLTPDIGQKFFVINTDQ